MKAPNCFDVEPLDPTESNAIRSLSRGDATEIQQKLAFAVILKKLARAYDQPFVPGAGDQTTFLAGRAFVGQQLLKHAKISPYED